MIVWAESSSQLPQHRLKLLLMVGADELLKTWRQKKDDINPNATLRLKLENTFATYI